MRQCNSFSQISFWGLNFRLCCEIYSASLTTSHGLLSDYGHDRPFTSRISVDVTSERVRVPFISNVKKRPSK
jgi:hypothetical protein